MSRRRTVVSRRAPLTRLVLLFAVVVGLTMGVGTGLPAPAHAAAKLRAWAHDGFGRMVFDWGAPVVHRLRRDGDRLEIRFGRPIGADPSLIEKRLPTYIDSAALDKDGRTLRLVLKGAFDHRTFREGTAVVFDFVPRPRTKGAGGAPVPRVEVRVGEHPGFTRLVADWKRPVAYRVRRNGRQAVILFDAPALLDLGSVLRDPPKHVTRVAASREGKGTVLRVTLPEGGRLRHYRSETSVVLDVMAGPGAAARPRSLARGGPATADPSKASKRIAVKAGTKDEAASVAKIVTPGTAAGSKLAGGDAVAARLVKSKDGLALRFEWPEITGAAFFRRAGFLWAVFDRPGPLDAGALPTGTRSVVTGYRAVPAGQGSALRLSLLPGFYPRIERDGTAWVVWLDRRPVKPSSALEVAVETSGLRGPRLFVVASDPGPPLTLRDPEVGDKLHVVPLPVLGQGIDGGRRHAKFRLLRTAQGIALEGKDDALRVERLRNGVEVTAQNGALHISPAGDKAAAARGQTTVTVVGRLLDLPRWGGLDKSFLEHKHELLSALAAAPPARRGIRRLALARFLFARGLATESLGVLRAIVEADAKAGADPAFRFLRGAARFMADRNEDAAADLSLPELVGHAEADLWRAALAARRFEWSKAAQSYAVGKDFLRSYPPLFRRRLARPAVEAALVGGFLEDTDFYLALFEDNAESAADIAEANYLRARLVLADGEVEEAARLLADLESSSNRLAGARASAALTELLLYNGTVTLAEAGERLEKLRFTWRGGDFEFELLKRLGTIYLEGGDYRNGLSTMKRLAANFPEKAEEFGVTDRMRAVFRALYLDGAADAIDPVTAIALFDEFRELTPAGAEGDAMIRKLAERLMSVDLLDRAADLLAHQVRFRLEGESRARSGTRLAAIRLLLKEPKAALEALELSAYDGAPREVITERRLLRAEAMMRLSQEDDALRLIDGLESEEAERMRVAILWRQRQWASAAAVIERLLDGLPRKGTALSESESGLVLNWAVAMSLLGDEFAITRLAQRFGEAMEDAPQRDAFLLVTTDTDGATDYESIVAQIGAVDRFAETLASYRERLQKGRVAAVN